MQVTVYTKPSCVQCDQTKRFLDKVNIPYTTVDITVDQEAFEDLVSKGYKAAPVVITDNDSWAGFNPAKLNKLAEEWV
jgi:glutaredoxin-like protein NrdH